MAVDSPPLDTLIGKVKKPGRVSIPKALDPSTRFPEISSFENESWRLNDNLMKNTSDVDFFDSDLSDGESRIDVMIEVYENPTGEFEQPRIFEYDPLLNEFSHKTYGDDGLPGGAGPNEDKLPNIPNNYSKIAHADLNNDDCNDLVLAGSHYIYYIDSNAYLGGVRNKLLLQEKRDGSCTGIFIDNADGFPTKETITVDVDIEDFNNDGLLDIFFTDKYLWPPSGTSETGIYQYGQMLINRSEPPDNVCCFEDESLKIKKYTPCPGRLEEDPLSSAACDIDNDGDIDIIQGVWWGSHVVSGDTFRYNRLFVNEGNGILVDYEDIMYSHPIIGDSLDIECVDLFNTSYGIIDGYPEIVIGYANLLDDSKDVKNMFLLNGFESYGYFIDSSEKLEERTDIRDLTIGVELCNIDNDPIPEIFFANGWRGDGHSQEPIQVENRLLDWDQAEGVFKDKANEFGFNFDVTKDTTVDIECVDVDGDAQVDIIFIGNYGTRNWLYFRQ